MDSLSKLFILLVLIYFFLLYSNIPIVISQHIFLGTLCDGSCEQHMFKLWIRTLYQQTIYIGLDKGTFGG